MKLFLLLLAFSISIKVLYIKCNIRNSWKEIWEGSRLWTGR